MFCRSRNLLIACLQANDAAAIEPLFSRVKLKDGEVLVKARAPAVTVYFPEGGVISVHEVRDDATRVGIGIVGFEGVAGWSPLLGDDYAHHEAAVAIGGGEALAISAQSLMHVCRERPTINNTLLLYVQSFVAQMSNTISSNLHDRLERRLARWLLMNHDRLLTDDLALTHEQLGIMLGVRRATVTDALHVIEGAELIRSTRRRITIRNRDGLIGFAGNAYGPAEHVYSRLIAPFPHYA